MIERSRVNYFANLFLRISQNLTIQFSKQEAINCWQLIHFQGPAGFLYLTFWLLLCCNLHCTNWHQQTFSFFSVLQYLWHVSLHAIWWFPLNLKYASIWKLNIFTARGQWTSENWLISPVHQVTFVVSHFNDPRILSADLRDLLLQSISVLVQYKEYLAAFESNEAATQRMPKALLSAFDNRSWIPVTNILLRLCKGSRFGSSKHGESSSSSSIVFQVKMIRFDFFFFFFSPNYLWAWIYSPFWLNLCRTCCEKLASMMKSCSQLFWIDYLIHSAGQWLSSLFPFGKCKKNTRYNLLIPRILWQLFNGFQKIRVYTLH